MTHNTSNHTSFSLTGETKGGLRLLVAFVIAVVCALTVQAKKQEVYLFGVATSFNDSTVCITEIQYIPDASIEDNRSKFLIGRDNYSYQLRDYLATEGLSNRTCATFWATSTKDIEKKYEKVVDKYVPDRKVKKKKKKNRTKQVRYNLRYLTLSEFSYKAVSADEGTVYVDAEKAEQAARESKRKEKKEMKKDAPGQMPPQGAGRPPMPQQ